MLIKKIPVQIPRGLYSATHATMFSEKLYSFNSKLILIKGEKRVFGGKDVIERSEMVVKILDLAIKKGEEITLIVCGYDEERTLVELEKFLGH